MNRSLAAFALCGMVCLLAGRPFAETSYGQPPAEKAENQAADQTADQAADTKGTEFLSGVDLLPASAAGMARIPELPAFCDAWENTRLGTLLASDEMKPFLDEQRDRATSYFGDLDRKIGLKPRDLYEIASGEVVISWLSFPEDKRRPFALCVIADVRGKKQAADQAAEKIEADLIAGGATRKDVTYGGETIRVYRTKPKPGQLKLDEIAITWNDQRFIAADRDIVVQQLLDTIAGKTPTGGFSSRQSYRRVIDDSMKAIKAADEKDATLCWQWYAEPFAMGRILRELFEYDRGGDLDIIQLLERQGFEVIQAFGGAGVVNGKRFDVLHRGVMLAPGKLAKAARMLQAFNVKRGEIPSWPTDDTGSFYLLNWKVEPAFWAAESLVNDALGEDLFRPMIEGIRDDPEGPQIDLAKDFLPNLDDQLILVTDNTMPAGPESDRMLLALRVKDAAAVAKVIQKAMEVEPDAIKLDIPDFDVWKVERGENDSDIDAELAALGFEEDLEGDDAAPLLNHWAIAVVTGPKDDDPAYLMFSSHSELLIQLGKRVRSGAQDGSLSQTQEAKLVVKSMGELKADEVTFEGVFRPGVSLRARYELLRQGKLKESDSLVANLLRRMVEENEEGEIDEIQASKLPPFNAIRKYFGSGGSFWQKTESGWSMTGFMLAE